METNLATIDAEQLSVIPTKTQVANATDSIVAIVEEGMVDPLKALATVTAIEKTFADAKKRITEYAINEAMKYSEKTISLAGATFCLKETGVKYDYSEDKEWSDLNDNMQEIKALMAGRETTLRQLGLCGKSSTTTVAVTLPK